MFWGKNNYHGQNEKYFKKASFIILLMHVFLNPAHEIERQFPSVHDEMEEFENLEEKLLLWESMCN